MSAYIISDVTIHDETSAAAYRERAARSIAQHGGRYLARAGAIEVLEGTWSPRAIIIVIIVIIVEFADFEQARTWYRSAEYAEALKFRDAALSRDLILVEGVASPP